MVTGNHITTLEWSSWLQVIISQHWNGCHGYFVHYNWSYFLHDAVEIFLLINEECIYMTYRYMPRHVT
jgi:hypothetical protein